MSLPSEACSEPVIEGTSGSMRGRQAGRQALGSIQVPSGAILTMIVTYEYGAVGNHFCTDGSDVGRQARGRKSGIGYKKLESKKSRHVN